MENHIGNHRLIRLVILSALCAGILTASWGYAQPCSERIAQPSYGIGIDMDGNVWVPQHFSGILRKYSPDGSLPASNTFDMQTSYNRGVAVTPVDNDVWVGGSRRNNAFDLVHGDTGAILKTFDVGVGGHGGIIACNDVLWSVSKTGLPGVFWYDTNQDITASVCCTPDILVDSNNDGVINEDDNDVEGTSPLVFPVNSDDDNLNGVSDFDDLGPVDFEDDLEEIQLFVSCHITDPTAWWSLSWTDPDPDGDPLTDTIRVWRQPDKSNGDEITPGPGQEIDNGYQYDDEWPPPASVWLESLATYDEMDLTLTVYVSDSRSLRFNTVQTRSSCTPAPITPPNKVGRYWVLVRKIGDFMGLEASITTDIQSPLCGEALTPFKNDSGSYTWIGIQDTTGSPSFDIWVQIGYGRSFLKGEDTLGIDGVYAEAVYGPDQFMERMLAGGQAPDPESHTYAIVYNGLGWEFLVDYTSTLPIFVNSVWSTFQYPTIAKMGGELINLEDRMSGTAFVPCLFRSIGVWVNSLGPLCHPDILLSPGDVKFLPAAPGASEWGKNVVSPTSFEIWDEKPNQ